MNKALFSILMCSFILASDYGYNGSTTGVVSLVGGIIKTKHIDKEKKYPRKNCPVCRGTGKYLSGDGIKMVDCGYCEPDTKLNAEPNSKTGVIKTHNSQCGPNGCKNTK